MEEELKNIWLSSPQEEKVKFQKSRLLLEMQNSVQRFDRSIWWRDAREIAAVIVIVPVFAYYCFTIPYLLSKISAGLTVVWAIYVAFKLLKTRQSKPSAYSDDYLTYLQETKAYLQRQQHLLESIFWWYIGPFLANMLLFVAGFYGVEGKEVWMICTIGLSIFFSVILYFLNKNVAKKDFGKRIEKVEELLVALEGRE
ncbi:MAG: hypothetical protein AB8G22_29205 [Saprospiraceae bacterium]